MKLKILLIGIFCGYQVNSTAQSITIDPSSSSTISTSRGTNYIDINKTVTNNTSGLRFLQNSVLQGGLFFNEDYNYFNLGNGVGTPGLVWNRGTQRAGIGTLSPSAKFQIVGANSASNPHLLIQETTSGVGARISFENTNVVNKKWTLFAKNENGRLPGDNVFNIFHTDFGNVAQFDGDGETKLNGNTEISGFTRLGSDAPKIKAKLYTGQLSPSFNDQYIFLDEAFTKIIDYSVLISANHTVTHLSVTTTYTYKFKPSNQNPTGYDYKASLRYPFGGVSPNGIIAIEDLGNNVIGRQYSIYITYTE